MQILGKTSVPVPRVHWMEEDADVLGVPFYVMDKLKRSTRKTVGVVGPPQKWLPELDSNQQPSG
jgi:aminoglycoside phosphotransferase (APT) family kinase protein